jgi:hypothetical protein
MPSDLIAKIDGGLHGIGVVLNGLGQTVRISKCEHISRDDNREAHTLAAAAKGMA